MEELYDKASHQYILGNLTETIKMLDSQSIENHFDSLFLRTSAHISAKNWNKALEDINKAENLKRYPADSKGPHDPCIECKAEKSDCQQEQACSRQRPAPLFSTKRGEITRCAQRAASISSRIRRIAPSRPTNTASPMR